jgi:L-rhamnose mutarotase
MKYTLIIWVLIFLISGCNTHEKDSNSDTVIRKGAVIKIKPEKLDFYKELHAQPWEGVNSKLKECNIRNYSIFYRDGYLFSYFEYTGINWEADMKNLASDSNIQAWWKLTDPCQEPVGFAKEGEWWAEMEEVFHLK